METGGRRGIKSVKKVSHIIWMTPEVLCWSHYALTQCFSTFLASSPGWKKNLSYCPGQKFLHWLCTIIMCFFLYNVSVIYVLLKIFPNMSNLANFDISKIFQVPVRRASYRDASRLLRNTAFTYWAQSYKSYNNNNLISANKFYKIDPCT
jgi:hypothetical protein